MNKTRQYLLALGLVCLGFSLTAVNAHAAPDSLVWRTNVNRVDADIRSWSLDTVLRQIAARTGWRVSVEPDTQQTVSVRFKDLPSGEALRRLLNNLNFALLRQSNAPPHLLVFRTSMQEATQLVSPAPADSAARPLARRIPNELIVTLKPGADIEALARSLGAKVLGRIPGLNAYRLGFDDSAAADLARRALQEAPDVASVDNNYAFDRPVGAREVLSTSLPPLQLKARAASGDGRVIVGLIDTAVHRLDGGLNEFLLPGLSAVGESSSARDALTHGGAMAETLLRGVQAAGGGQSGVRVLPVDVYGASGSTTTFQVAGGVYQAVNNGGATILNLSLGSDGDSPFLHDLLQSASRQGVLILAAAGNTPTTAPTYPAAYPEVIAVTAGDRTGQIAPYANRGDFVDLVAPGVSIVYFNGQPFYVSGTSAATAFATGLAAGLADGSGKKAADIEAALKAMLGAKAPPKP